jgi:DNA-binding HxlR family transcriptional regulator
MEKQCPVQAAVTVMGGKWKPGILFRLKDSTYRFGVLKRQMPWISEKVLIRQLKELVESGVVRRIDHGGVPPAVEYALSPYGETLLPLLLSMADWGEKHLQHDHEARAIR